METARRWFLNQAQFGKRLLGLDRATAYTVLARACNILGSAGTVLLIMRFMNSVEQGYYYTLLSLVNLQIVFELGFSVVIQQFAAHECAHLIVHDDGRLEGDPRAHARLASILRKTVRWYVGASLLMALILTPAGIFFFLRNAHTSDHVAWQSPWAVTVLSCVVLFFLNPLSSFLEGCGQVRQVAGLRLGQAVIGSVAAWAALIAHRGLYAPAAVIIVYIAVAGWFLWRRRRLMLELLLHRSDFKTVSWRGEVWPFQWKIGVSSLGAYVAVQVFTPALFMFRGPVEAGRMGMSINIAGYLWTVALAWISTKATPFGQMIARGQFEQLDTLFFQTLRQSAALLCSLIAACMAAVLAMQSLYPRFAERILSPGLFGLVLLTSLATFFVQSEAIYLRAHKREPFLGQSLAVCGLTILGVYLLVPRWGASGVAIVYLFSTGVVGLALATVVFFFQRQHRDRNRDMLISEIEA